MIELIRDEISTWAAPENRAEAVEAFKIAAILIPLFAGFHFLYRAFDPLRFRSAGAEARDFTIGWVCVGLAVVALGYTLSSL